MYIIRWVWLYSDHYHNKDKEYREFPGGPVIRLHTSTAGDPSLIPGPSIKIPHAMQPAQHPMKTMKNISITSINR